ncbi:hypothetical protein JCM6882_001474 [Rhodosporidiobolus microsporus]
MAASKVYDIIVFGATGFTGQLVAKYLAQEAPKQGFSFAVAGRNKEKILSRMKEVEVKPAEVFVANADDEGALRAVVKKCKVVISLVGPYLAHGDPLVKVVAEEGVHYVDLTGETPFVYNSVKNHSRAALSTKSLILHACGYDSVPSDLCAYLAVQKLKQLAPGVEAGQVRAAFSGKGTLSGGTLATGLGLLNRPTEERKLTQEPYALSPVQGSDRPSPVLVSSHTFNRHRTFGGFWMMGPFNTQIVRRSWGILESADPSSRVLSYGPKFRYNEFLKTGGRISALLLSLTMYIGFASLYLLPPLRALVARFGPQPGTGPSKEMQENGWFKVETVAKSVDDKYEARAIMKGKGDPGYGATAIMISACALSLLKDYDRLPSIAKHGGHLTPATALGEVLIERLEKTGRFSFEVEEGTRKER